MAKLEKLWERWWVRVLSVWGVTRLISLVLFLWVSSYQEKSYWNEAHPGYFDLLNIWDAEWYNRIFTHGYPISLPLNANGLVAQNEWAFNPLYPFLVRVLSEITLLEWKYSSAIFSTIISFVLALALYKT
ncbi:MAG: hypothetical protein ACKOWE_06720, partial [Micrococcales bacterium]